MTSCAISSARICAPTPSASRSPGGPTPTRAPRPLPTLNYGNQAGGGTVHYGALSWRFHEDDFRARSQTIERYGAAAIPEDSSLVDWPLSYADLEPFYDRAEYELGVSGKAGNLQGQKIDGGNVFEAPRQREYPLPPLLGRPVGRHLRRRRQEARLSPVLVAARDPLAALQGPAGLHLLRLLPGLRLPHRREIEHPGDQAARGRRDRQFQADHRRHVLPRQQRQQRPRDRRVLLRARTAPTTRSRPSSSSSRPSSTTIRACCCCRRPRNSRTGSPIRAAMLGKHIMTHIDGEGVRRLRRPPRQHLHGAERAEAQHRRFQRRQFRPRRARASSAARRFRSAPPTSKAARSAPPTHEPAARRAALGRGLSRLLRQILTRATPRSRRRPRTCPTRTRRSISIRTCATPGACRRRA